MQEEFHFFIRKSRHTSQLSTSIHSSLIRIQSTMGVTTRSRTEASQQANAVSNTEGVSTVFNAMAVPPHSTFLLLTTL